MTPDGKSIEATRVALRVQHLLRLGADSGASENEARNAAVTAARLVLQYDLIVSPRFALDQERDKRQRAEAREAEARRACEAKAREAREATDRATKAQEAAATWEAKARKAEAGKAEADKAETSESKKRRRIRLQFPCACVGCQRLLNEGDFGWWRKGAGATCLECGALVP
jgi:hypothetical protein